MNAIKVEKIYDARFSHFEKDSFGLPKAIDKWGWFDLNLNIPYCEIKAFKEEDGRFIIISNNTQYSVSKKEYAKYIKYLK